MVLFRVWPMDQVEIYIIQLELLQAGFQGLLRIMLIIVPQFCGDKQFITGNSRRFQRLAHTFFIFINSGGIN